MKYFYKIRHINTGLFYKPGQTGFMEASSLTPLGKSYDSIGKVKSAAKNITHYNDDNKNSYSKINFNEHFEIVEYKVIENKTIKLS